MNDEMLKLCIQQGYVPNECSLDGMVVFLLTKEGENPCVGCGKNCSHRIPSKTDVYKQFGLTVEEMEYQRRVEKRDILGTSKESIMFVDADTKTVSIRVMNPEAEKCYITRVRNPHDASYLIPEISRKYGAKQIFIETSTNGTFAIFDHLRTKNIMDLDIIPVRLAHMDFDNRYI